MCVRVCVYRYTMFSLSVSLFLFLSLSNLRRHTYVRLAPACVILCHISSIFHDTVKCMPLAGAMGIALVCFFPFSADPDLNAYLFTNVPSTTLASNSAKY